MGPHEIMLTHYPFLVDFFVEPSSALRRFVRSDFRGSGGLSMRYKLRFASRFQLENGVRDLLVQLDPGVLGEAIVA